LYAALFAFKFALSMFSLNPRITLLLLLGLAVIILAAGLGLARREESLRLDRDRTALRECASELQSQLQRLEGLYEEHLTDLARSFKSAQPFEVRHSADGIVGIQQVSFLRRGARTDAHVNVYGQRLPIPVLQVPASGLTAPPVLLSENRLFNVDGTANGWIDDPGKPLLFWQRRSSSEAVVFLIDRVAVETAIDGWLGKGTSQRFEPVRLLGGPDQLRGHDARALLSVGDAGSDRPDLLLPLRSRFGSWELASWDHREIRIRYNLATAITASVLSICVGAIGLVVFGQQRRAAALAAQRVSFVNRVSHELRSPLTNILLNLDLAAEALGDTPGRANRRLDLVQEEARRLGRLIDNVLTFSRHEQGKLRAEARACVPASVIAAVMEQFSPSFARRALDVRCAGDLTAPCLLDADAFAQILANLLSNVEKYVPGGVVEIAGTLDDGVLTVTVADQGPGIPPEATERIFRPFERLDSRVNEGASGTGLGLAIARDLATTMGGTLRLLPSLRGACFELRVPAPPAEPLKSISAA